MTPDKDFFGISSVFGNIIKNPGQSCGSILYIYGIFDIGCFAVIRGDDNKLLVMLLALLPFSQILSPACDGDDLKPGMALKCWQADVTQDADLLPQIHQIPAKCL